MIMALSEQTVERLQRVKYLIIKGIKKFLTFLLSHVGLTLAVAGYNIVGGMIFQHIEAPHEIVLRQKAIDARERLNKRLLELTDNINVVTHQKEWAKEAENLLIEFQEEVFSLTNNEGWDGTEMDDELQWSFPGALLYCVTVITTIGYGHIAPKTGWGRVITIFYAIVGIPLTLLCLRNIGTFLSAIVRIFYKYTCVQLVKQYKRCRKRLNQSRRLKYLQELAKRRGIDLRLLNGKAELVQPDELPTVNVEQGSTNHIPIENTPRLSRPSSFLEVPRKLSRASSIQSLTEILKNNLEVPHSSSNRASPLNSPRGSFKKKLEPSRSRSVSRAGSLQSITDSSRRTPKEPVTEEQVRVPVTLTFLILVGYIIGGAIMFGLWEKEWDILIGSYFCFITLSTIGFGDFVPGSSADSWSNHEKNVICSAYLLFGMAIMAMCFHLMQEEVKLKCKRLAERIGLFKEELVKDIQ